MDPDELLAELNALTRIPSSQTHNGSLIAHKFNQLCDYMSMGCRPPKHWVDSTSPYAREKERWLRDFLAEAIAADEAAAAPAPKLQFDARWDCEQCGTTYIEHWEDDSLSLEDMAEPPVTDSTCPSCGHVHKKLEWPGWMFRSEAG